MLSLLLNRIKQIALGHSLVIYRDKKYAVTKSIFNNEKSFKINAEELGGTDFISLNYYLLKSGNLLKPCEMPESKVIHFLMNYKEVLDS